MDGRESARRTIRGGETDRARTRFHLRELLRTGGCLRRGDIGWTDVLRVIRISFARFERPGVRALGIMGRDSAKGLISLGPAVRRGGRICHGWTRACAADDSWWRDGPTRTRFHLRELLWTGGCLRRGDIGWTDVLRVIRISFARIERPGVPALGIMGRDSAKGLISLGPAVRRGGRICHGWTRACAADDSWWRDGPRANAISFARFAVDGRVSPSRRYRMDGRTAGDQDFICAN